MTTTDLMIVIIFCVLVAQSIVNFDLRRRIQRLENMETSKIEHLRKRLREYGIDPS